MSWKIVYTKQAQKDAKKLAQSGLKGKAKKLLEIIEKNPYQMRVTKINDGLSPFFYHII